MKKIIVMFVVMFSSSAFSEGCPRANPGYQLVQVPDDWELHQIVSIDNSQVFLPVVDDPKTCEDYIEDGRPLPDYCCEIGDYPDYCPSIPVR